MFLIFFSETFCFPNKCLPVLFVKEYNIDYLDSKVMRAAFPKLRRRKLFSESGIHIKYKLPLERLCP